MQSLPVEGRAGEHSCKLAVLPTLSPPPKTLRQPLSKATQTKHEEFGPLTPNLQLTALKDQDGLNNCVGWWPPEGMRWLWVSEGALALGSKS